MENVLRCDLTNQPCGARLIPCECEPCKARAEIARLRAELQTSQNICQAAGIRDGNLITTLRAQLATAREALAGAELALARDENIEAAVQIITKTRAALSRLASPGAQQFSHWRPIDAEARSSGRILAAELKRPNEWWVRICSWVADRGQEGFWYAGGNDAAFPFRPTLWMPIPSPGAQQHAGENGG